MCQTYKEIRTAKNGDTMHTCNGDVKSGLPFGKKAAPGVCKRCDELRNGASPRQTNQSFKAKQEARELVYIKQHFQTCPICTGKVSGVCTFGEW